jgi:hypothetical protein
MSKGADLHSQHSQRLDVCDSHAAKSSSIVHLFNSPHIRRARTKLKSGIKGSTLPIVIAESQSSFSLFYHSANRRHSNEHTEVWDTFRWRFLSKHWIDSVGHERALDER